jgi:hypothetical protein
VAKLYSKEFNNAAFLGLDLNLRSLVELEGIFVPYPSAQLGFLFVSTS